ncbi:MAG: flagellar hook protein FlgE [Ignavibacteria bacterium]|nr:flagellar hook protein FlgE [Ignavibacteria bacterium]
MAISRTLAIGTSSLRSHQRKFDVIANNVANINTTGFKASRTNFVEHFNQVYKRGKSPETLATRTIGGYGPLQYGLGVRVGSISPDMSQGVIETTGKPLDLAIQGEGFFVYNHYGRQFYSRSAPLTRDSEGYLVDPTTGAILQGYNIVRDANGLIVRDAQGLSSLEKLTSNIRIPSNLISAPKQTQNIKLNGNLNASAPTNFTSATSIIIYDNKGAAHTLKFTFTKTANLNEWSLSAEIDGNPLTISATTLTFNNDGTLASPTTLTITAADLNTALNQAVFDNTTPKNITVEIAPTGNLLQGLTQFAGLNTANFSYQDGYTSGDLSELNVDDTGKVWGAFTNGKTELLAQIAIARFPNQDALIREGNNFFSPSPNSGLPIIGTAGETFPSTQIFSGALEQSNVDLAEQFTQIISTQRAYEAAARTITVTDIMLAETNNLKR